MDQVPYLPGLLPDVFGNTPDRPDDFDDQRDLDGAACRAAALRYVALGWSIIPLCPPDHACCSRQHINSCGDKQGKRPLIDWKDCMDTPPTAADVRSWWERWPRANPGLVLGHVSRVIRIDVEGPLGEEELLRRADGDLPETVCFRSGRRDGTGRGLLYAPPEGAAMKTTRKPLAVGQELRLQTRGAQTVLPPARHRSGGLYAWLPGCSPWETRVAPAPAWLMRELEEAAGGTRNGTPHRTLADWENLFSGVDHGARNDTATVVIGKMLAHVGDIDNPGAVQSVYLAAQAVNRQNDPPMCDEELQKAFLSILRSEKAKRARRDLEELDRVVSLQIQESSDPTPDGTHDDGGEPSLPDWHLVVVESNPPEYLLRSPYWSACAKLAGGYVRLTEEELLAWRRVKESIPRAVFAQTGLIVPPVIRGWSLPDGQLQQLMATAERRAAIPEMNADLVILAFIYRYLTAATAPRTDDDGTTLLPESGRPWRSPDGSVTFKLEHLIEHARFSRQEWGRREITAVLHTHAEQTYPDRTRWWRVTDAGMFRLASLTAERQEPPPQQEHAG